MTEDFVYPDPYTHFWSGDELKRARTAGVNPYGYKVADPRPPCSFSSHIPICGAKKSGEGKNGEICKKPAWFNEDTGWFNRCKNHGGMKHVSANRVKTGQRSAQPKTKLAKFIEKAEKNPDLISIKKNIAVQQGMIETLLARYEDEEDPKLFREIASLNKTQGDLLKQQKEIEEGLTLNIHSDQLMFLMNALVSIISRNLTSYPELLAPIIREIEDVYVLEPKAIEA